MNRSVNNWLLICIGWGVGTAGMAVFNFSRTILLRFMTDYLEIAAIAAGLLFAFSKVFDAVTDPIMGMITDKTNTRWGRRRPYLLLGSFLCGIAYMLLFNVPDIDSAPLLIAYMTMVLMFYAVSYTIFNVPYLAMPVEITSDYHSRSFLVSFRAIGVGFGNLLAGVLGPLIIVAYGGGIAGHRVMSWALGGITTTLLLLSFALTAYAPFSRPSAIGSGSFFENISSIRKNRPYVVLLSAKGLFFVAVAVLTTSSAFFTTHVLGLSDKILALFFGTFFLGVALSQPIWLRVAKHWDKPATYTVACVLLAIVNLTWLAADATEPRLIFIARSISVGMMMGGVMVMGNSMLPDTLDFDRRHNAAHREGLMAGFYSTLEKGGSAIGIAIVGVMLGLMGYVESGANEIVQQSAETINAIRVCFAVIPAAAIFLSGLVMRLYTLRVDSFTETSER